MSKKPFRFKQFVLNHHQTPMKIGVDGVLLGAWSNHPSPKNILDIGGGCGLIGFMLKQKHIESLVYIIEPNDLAYNELLRNISINNSKNILTEKVSLQEFECDFKFDLIVSNPPFYKEDNITDPNRAQARQQQYLPISSLFNKVNHLLSINGSFCIVYPSDYFQEIISEANKNDLFLSRKTEIYGNEHSNCKRLLLEFKKTKNVVIENKLIIEIERNLYHPDYITLTKDFYLNF